MMVRMARSTSRKRRPPSEVLSRWFHRARDREAGALQQLLSFYRPLLMKLAHQRLKRAVRTKVAPSDIVQATVWAATQEFESKEFANRKAFLAWLLTILEHEAADERGRFQETQKRDISRERPLDSPETQLWLRRLSVSLSGSNGTSSRKLADIEAILAALRTLPPHYRLVIHLRFYERLKFDDIGRQLNRSPDAARVLHNRALLKLRDAVDSGHQAEPPDTNDN